MFKRLSIHFCLAALLVHSVGFVVVALAEIGCAKLDAAARTTLREVENGWKTFRFSQTDFEKTVGQNHEFWLDGQLFDLKSIKIEGDSIEIIAAQDDFETQALFHLTQFFQKNESNQPFKNDGLPQLIFQILNDSFLPPTIAAWPIFSKNESKKAAFFFLEKRLVGHRFLFSPPPEGFV